MMAKIRKIIGHDLPSYVKQYGFVVGIKNIIQTKLERLSAKKESEKVVLLKKLLSEKTIIILTSPHCLFVAQLLKEEFKYFGFKVTISDTYQLINHNCLHIVIAPQMFKPLPQYYIAFQMEQSVSSRWFTRKYFNILKKALLIFDYSQDNIAFLVAHGIGLKKIQFLPIGFSENYSDYYQTLKYENANKKYDITFYGDIKNKRRENFISEISKSHNVNVCNEVFGKDITDIIAQSKIVLNIHYYENALLETTRIYESLSLNTLVISEQSSDQQYYQHLEDIVEFVPINDIALMNSTISFWLNHPEELAHKINSNRHKLIMRSNIFNNSFARFLLAYNIIEAKDCNLIHEAASWTQELSVPFYCLSILETPHRRSDFLNDNHYKIKICDGVKHLIGWVGCGMSFQYIIQKAHEEKCDMVIICEDDALFAENFGNRISSILQYLKSHSKKWDIYSGMLVDVPEDTTILAIDNYEQEKFVFLDKIISMVFNIYNASSFHKIMQWNEHKANNPNIANTIDEYIKHSGLKFVTSYPFLVSHKEDSSSTIWGNNVKNRLIYQYRFKKALELLKSKITQFETRGTT